MNQSPNWQQLLESLQRKTRQGSLQWESDQTNLGIDDRSFAMALDEGLRVFRSAASKSSYELSGSKSWNRAPFELKIWDNKSRRGKPLFSLTSTLDNFASGGFAINRELEALFAAVEDSIESPNETINRLLEDLDNL